MEFLPGGDLYSLLDSMGSLDEDVAKLYTMEILDALKYLRSNGIIHRDIKPDNVLVSTTGALKLTDFGLSHLGAFDRQAVISDPSLASANSFVGTPDYTAPEIILSHPHSFTADYWSLGVMLYEFLMGEPPFHGENEEETHTNILRAKIDFEEMEEDGCSPEVIDLLKKLFVIDPHKRLGENSIEEIIQHPWFKGVDTKTAEPPFVPELANTADTNYFQQRYTFKEEDDSDILEDIVDVNPNYHSEISTEIAKFQAVAVDQLKEKNSKVVHDLKRHHSLNTDLPKKSKNKSSGEFNSANLTVASLLSSPESSTQNSSKDQKESKKMKKSLKSNSFSNLDAFDLLSSSLLDNDENNETKKKSPLLFQLNNSQSKKAPSKDGPTLSDLLGPICQENNDNEDDDDDDGLSGFPQFQANIPSFTKKPPVSSPQVNNEYEYEIIEEEEEEEEEIEEPIKKQDHRNKQQIRLGVIKSSSSSSIDFSELMKNRSKNSSSSRGSNLSNFSDKVSSLSSRNSNLDEENHSNESSNSLLSSNSGLQLKLNSNSASNPNISPQNLRETHRGHSSSISNHNKQQVSDQLSHIFDPDDKLAENKTPAPKSPRHIHIVLQNDDLIRRPQNSNGNNNSKQKVNFNENKDDDRDDENENTINSRNSPSLVSDDEED